MKNETKLKAIELLKTNQFTQKEIAKMLKVSEQSLSRWAKELHKKDKYQELVTQEIKKRLYEIAQNHDTTPKDIYLLVLSINLLENKNIQNNPVFKNLLTKYAKQLDTDL